MFSALSEYDHQDIEALQTAWRLSILGFKANARRNLKCHIVPVSVPALCQDIVERFQHDIRSSSSLLHGVSLIHKFKTNLLMEDARLAITRLRQTRRPETLNTNSLCTIDQWSIQTNPNYLKAADYMEHMALVPHFTWFEDELQKKRKLEHVTSTDNAFNPFVGQNAETQHQSLVNTFLESNEIGHDLDFEFDAEDLQPIMRGSNHDEDQVDRELAALLEVETLPLPHYAQNCPVVQSHSITNDPNFGLSGTESGFPVLASPRKATIRVPRSKRTIVDVTPEDMCLGSCTIAHRQQDYFYRMDLRSNLGDTVYDEIVHTFKTERIRLLRGVFRVFLRRSIPEFKKQALTISATVSHLEGMNTELEFERRLQEFEIPHDETEIGRNKPPRSALFVDDDTVDFALDDNDVRPAFGDWNDGMTQELPSDMFTEVETLAEYRESPSSLDLHTAVRLNRFMSFLKSRCAEIDTASQNTSPLASISFAQLIPSQGRLVVDNSLVLVSRKHAARSFSSLLVLATHGKIEIGCENQGSCSAMTTHDVIVTIRTDLARA